MARTILRAAPGRAEHEPHRGMILPGMTGQASIELYLGLGRAAYQRVCAQWAELARSGELSVPSHYVLALWLYGRAALAAAGQSASQGQREDLLRRVERLARRISGRRLRCSEGLALLLCAGAAAVRRDRETAARLAQAAAEACEAADMHAVAASARRRHGELLGGAPGQAAMAAADAWMSAEQVRNLSRFTALLAPGFPTADTASPRT